VERLPFSVYDFFACLSSGFLLIAAVDYAFDQGSLLTRGAAFLLDIVLVMAAYALGHVVAEFASLVYERGLVRAKLGEPTGHLLGTPAGSRRWRRVSRSYCEPLPEGTQLRVRAQAQARAFSGSERAFFYHCHAIVKRDPVVLDRLSTFLNLYGFARNNSFAALLAAPILIAGAVHNHNDATRKLWLAAAAVLAAVGLFYRYLKFFRLYAVEVFVSYAEISP
jgi:hypothetical protein